jgi:hypothetical protein
MLVSADDTRYGEEHLLDDFTEDMAIGYAFGPPYGDRLVTWADLERLRMGGRVLRRTATDNLYAALTRLRIHGQPPALMLSFDGLESSALLVDEFWDDLERSVPGDLVVGVPARDVVIITGTESPPGLEKARRAVDRVFFAGDQHLLSRDLLVWRQGGWQQFGPPTAGSGQVPRWQEPPPPAGPTSGPPPRQYRSIDRWSEDPAPAGWADDEDDEEPAGYDPEPADWEAPVSRSDEPDPPHWERGRPPRPGPPPEPRPPRQPGRPPVRWSDAPPPEELGRRRRRPNGPLR